jgi:hypothetical protein
MFKTAQIESGMRPNPNAGWPENNVLNLNEKNWADLGGGDVGNPNLQADHGAKYLAQMQAKAHDVLGRDPQDWETYILHQQGPAGGPALFRAPQGMSAVEALTPAYANYGEKARQMAQKAVLGNQGDLTMSAQDFVNLQHQRFEGYGGRVNLGAPMPAGGGPGLGTQVNAPGAGSVGLGTPPVGQPGGGAGNLGVMAPSAVASRQDYTQSPWFPMMAAGLGMMASRSPWALGGIGEGGLQGIKTAENVADRGMRERQIENEAANRQAALGLEAQRVQQTGTYQTGELAQRQSQLAAEQGHWADQLKAEQARFNIEMTRDDTADKRADIISQHYAAMDAINAGYKAYQMSKPINYYDPQTGKPGTTSFSLEKGIEIPEGSVVGKMPTESANMRDARTIATQKGVSLDDAYDFVRHGRDAGYRTVEDYVKDVHAEASSLARNWQADLNNIGKTAPDFEQQARNTVLSRRATAPGAPGPAPTSARPAPSDTKPTPDLSKYEGQVITQGGVRYKITNGVPVQLTSSPP